MDPAACISAEAAGGAAGSRPFFGLARLGDLTSTRNCATAFRPLTITRSL